MSFNFTPSNGDHFGGGGTGQDSLPGNACQQAPGMARCAAVIVTTTTLPTAQQHTGLKGGTQMNDQVRMPSASRCHDKENCRRALA